MTQPREVADSQERGPFDLDAFVISLEGEFDLAERTRLLDAFAITTSSPIVIINFEKTRYIDSTVLECLVALERTIAERGARLILVGLRPEIRRVFDVCGLQRLFDIRDTLAVVAKALAVEASRVRKLSLIAEPTVAAAAVDIHLSETR